MPSPRRWVSVLAMVAVLGACGSDGDSVDPGDRAAIPDGQPATRLDPAGVSGQWRTITHDGFRIGAPSSFRERVRTTSSGDDMLWLDARRSSGSRDSVIRVAVVPDVDPTASVLQQSHALEQKQTIGENEVRRSRVEWPGAREAVLVQWSNPVRGTGKSIETWQLMVEVDDELILNVVAIAPEGAVEEHDLDRIIATFRPQ